jgi:hypothetical protein
MPTTGPDAAQLSQSPMMNLFSRVQILLTPSRWLIRRKECTVGYVVFFGFAALITCVTYSRRVYYRPTNNVSICAVQILYDAAALSRLPFY